VTSGDIQPGTKLNDFAMFKAYLFTIKAVASLNLLLAFSRIGEGDGLFFGQNGDISFFLPVLLNRLSNQPVNPNILLN